MAKITKFKFEANQQHQIEAIESVVDLFNGFSQEIIDFQLEHDVIPNVPDLHDFDEEWLYSNYQRVIEKNNNARISVGLQPDLPLNPSLIFDDGFMLSGISDHSIRFPVFTIEMETGTGKTYTYFRTIQELKQKCGFRKFIIVVPSIAIYEGTIKAFNQTKEHLRTLYSNEIFHIIEYDSQHISKLRTFANSSFIEIMVMTIDSFNRSGNNIFKPTEKLQGEWLPFQYIQATRPILILDESQNYRSNLSRQALRTLNPLFAINYSATPMDKYNLLYRLSPVDAFRHNLVKKINVLGVTQQHNLNDNELSLAIESINNEHGLPTAVLKAYCLINGEKKQQSLNIKKGDDLFIKTRNPDFSGFIVEEIHAGNNTITFTNQSVLSSSGAEGITLSKREIFRVQIEETIKFHMERQKELRPKGIKVLSLFFIDRVANYKGEEPLIKILFEAAFDKLKHLDEKSKDLNSNDVHKGYFAHKKGETTFLESLDTSAASATEKKKIQEAEKEAYHLIMIEKEKLLSFSEKTSFIFAHSALREGWDNPNVFTICTLNTSQSENRKRQEIGRGLRLARNDNGDQVKEEGVNILTVVANESYEDYVNSLQTEYTETGDVAPPKPTKPREDSAKRNNKLFSSSDFKNFWENLSKQTEYKINIDTPELISQCITKINSDKTLFPEPQIIITRGEFIISNYTFNLLQSKPGQARIKLNITDIKGRNDIFDQWYPVGYDFGRKTKDVNLSGFKIVQIDDHATDPVIYFGNGVPLLIAQPHSFSGNPQSVNHQRSVQEAQDTYPVFNLIERTSKAIGLTRPTINAIFKGLNESRKAKIFNNPEGFSTVFIKEIREQLANHIADKIEYSLTNDLQKLDKEDLFPKLKKYTQRELIPGSTNSLYDKIQTDSDVERRFVVNKLQPDDVDGNVILYFKFPASFKIHMPKIISNYNPDWGIIRIGKDGSANVQLVRETKGTMNPNLLQFPNEKRKIDCAKKHFSTIGVKYRQVTDTYPLNYWEDETAVTTNQPLPL
jgi:type III restriction enzyme